MSSYVRTLERGEAQVTTLPQPPPEAALIAQLREAQVPKLSMREAARRARFSVATWTQNEQGYRKVASDVIIPITATAEKLARMALVVGAKPDQLEATGRQDAAEVLRKIMESESDPASQLIQAVRLNRELTDQQKREIIERLERDRLLAWGSTRQLATG